MQGTILRQKHFDDLGLPSYQTGYWQLTDEITIDAENNLRLDSDYTTRAIWLGEVHTEEELKVLRNILSR